MAGHGHISCSDSGFVPGDKVFKLVDFLLLLVIGGFKLRLFYRINLLEMGEAVVSGAGELVSDVASGAGKVCEAVADSVGKAATAVTDGVKSFWKSATSWAFG